jgi:hypothetical protein
MNTKLTLTIEKSVIDNGKNHATPINRSLSDLKISPLVNSLKGSFHLQEIFDYKNEMTDILSEKYLSNKITNKTSPQKINIYSLLF